MAGYKDSTLRLPHPNQRHPRTHTQPAPARRPCATADRTQPHRRAQHRRSTWRLTPEAWWQKFRHLITKERSLYDNGQFGFTHAKLRKAWGILHRAAEAGHIFTNLQHGNPRATSRLEGLNSRIRNLLRHHRGMPIEHPRRAAEWFVLLHEIPTEQAHNHAHAPEPALPASAPKEALGPALYDTGLSAEEGLWHRSGWSKAH